MKHITLLLSLALAACAHGAAQQTQRLTATKANDYAMVYTLPTTQIVVTLEAEITVEKPGEFYKYAKKYLSENPRITAEKHSARLLGATVYTRGVPNDEERYAVQFKSGSTPTMLLTSNGLPLSLNTERTAQEAIPALPAPRKAEPTPLQTPAARQVVSEEMSLSQSSAKKAELAAQALFAIRQTRSELITGQAENMPPDGRSLELMLASLEAQEQALLAMFMGTTQSHTQVESFVLTPGADGDEEADMTVTLARLSSLDGLVGPDDLSGSPVRLTLRTLSRGEMPVNDKGVALPFPKGGVAYCIPGEARVIVSYDGRDLADKNVALAQLGVVYGLNPQIFTDRKAPAYAIFDPATGAIVRTGTE